MMKKMKTGLFWFSVWVLSAYVVVVFVVIISGAVVPEAARVVQCEDGTYEVERQRELWEWRALMGPYASLEEARSNAQWWVDLNRRCEGKRKVIEVLR